MVDSPVSSGGRPPDPYARPASTDATPNAILLFRFYAVGMAVIHGASVVGFAAIVPTGDALRVPILVGLSLLAAFHLFAAFVPRAPWGWTVALVAIALGLPTVTVVVALLLLLAWRGPLVKAAFRRL